MPGPLANGARPAGTDSGPEAVLTRKGCCSSHVVRAPPFRETLADSTMFRRRIPKAQAAAGVIGIAAPAEKEPACYRMFT